MTKIGWKTGDVDFHHLEFLDRISLGNVGVLNSVHETNRFTHTIPAFTSYYAEAVPVVLLPHSFRATSLHYCIRQTTIKHHWVHNILWLSLILSSVQYIHTCNDLYFINSSHAEPQNPVLISSYFEKMVNDGSWTIMRIMSLYWRGHLGF